MKVLHVISGGETGGSRKYIMTLLPKFAKENVSLLVFQEGKLLDEAKENGIDVYLFKQTSRYDVSVLSRYTSFINKGGYDIVHTHGPRSNLFTYLIRNKIQAKWVTTIHSDPTLDFVKSGTKGKIFTRLHLFAVKAVDLLITVSPDLKRQMARLGVPNEKIVVVYNGVEFNRTPFHPAITKQSMGLSDCFVMTMIARLHPIKGHEVLFEALQGMENEHIKVLLVGDGPIRTKLEELVREKALSSTVRFLGFRKDIDEILSITDVSLLTSYSEGFGLVLLEAAQQKVPCIATDVGVVSELMNTSSMGWIIPPKDAKALRTAIEQAYDCYNEGKLASMGERLYERAVAHFSADNLYENTCGAYKTLV